MGRVFACSDLHGRYDLFSKLKRYMGEDDVCYVLGDCVDRGSCSIRILMDIMVDKRFKMLKGNHEAMMVEALDAAEQGYMDFQLWYGNGGQKTHMELMEHDESIQSQIVSFCRSLPLKLEYKDMILTHAGFEWSQDDPDEDILLWDRSHIGSKTKAPRDYWQVHGHTPVQSITGGAEILFYEDRKICIDIGCTFIGKLAVLDLDTLETMYIKGGA